jgi:hypothetical protein
MATGFARSTTQELIDIFMDSDSEGEFEGFSDDNRTNTELPAVNIDYETPENDPEIDADVQLGWSKQHDGGIYAISFTGESRLTADLPDGFKPIDVFKLFFTDELL